MGPLDGIRVVELASEQSAFAGKLMADLGADVVVVEPPGGHRTRTFEPFLDDEPGVERSLWWWHYNTSKRGVELDLTSDDGADLFRALVGRADIVLEGEPPDALAKVGLDYLDFYAHRPELIWTSITPFGRSAPRSQEQSTDLTLLASSGHVWSCGYDDHSIPPVRGGGNQAFQAPATYAVLATLTAWLSRCRTGRGQLIDVNMFAALNVTTELGTSMYLDSGQTVQRQTGRHAFPTPSLPTIVEGADGRLAHTGTMPRTSAEISKLLSLLDDSGLGQEFPERFFLEMGAARDDLRFSEAAPPEEVEAQAIYSACREALLYMASRLPAYDFFVLAQRHGLGAGIVYTPEEVLTDPHFVLRGLPVGVDHDDLGHVFAYPGQPVRFPSTPTPITRAPHVGEHNHAVLDELRPVRR